MDTSTSFLRRSKRPTPTITDPNSSITMSPAHPRSLQRNSSVESLDEEYFDKTYVPLSSLPTPPLSCHSNASSRRVSYEHAYGNAEYLNPNLLGPAIHLMNLVPTSISIEQSSIETIHAMITRADLPYETIALAVNILDSLSSRFAPCFRQSFPSSRNTENITSPINPAIVPLAALTLSVKFLDDAQQSTRYYVQHWARNMWTCQQVNYTERCLLENLGGRLLPLWDEDMILCALQDMERAGRLVEKPQDEQSDVKGVRGMDDGKAVLNVYHQITPGESPQLLAEELKMVHLGDVSGLSLDG